jgi:hypothetical protein
MASRLLDRAGKPSSKLTGIFAPARAAVPELLNGVAVPCLGLRIVLLGAATAAPLFFRLSTTGVIAGASTTACPGSLTTAGFAALTTRLRTADLRFGFRTGLETANAASGLAIAGLEGTVRFAFEARLAIPVVCVTADVRRFKSRGSCVAFCGKGRACLRRLLLLEGALGRAVAFLAVFAVVAFLLPVRDTLGFTGSDRFWGVSFFLRIKDFRVPGCFFNPDFVLATALDALDRAESPVFLELVRFVAAVCFRARRRAAFLALTFRDDGFCRFISEPPLGTPGFFW